MGVPSFAVRRYFLSHMSSDASWNGTASMSLGSILTTVFMDRRRSDFSIRLLHAHFHERGSDPDASCRASVTSRENSPDRAILDRVLRNTRSCVGVKRLVTRAALVNMPGQILSHPICAYPSRTYDDMSCKNPALPCEIAMLVTETATP